MCDEYEMIFVGAWGANSTEGICQGIDVCMGGELVCVMMNDKRRGTAVVAMKVWGYWRAG